MCFIDDWDQEIYKKIAKASGSAQAVKDVSYARFVFHCAKKGQEPIHVRISDKAFLLGMLYNDSLRIIGIAVDISFQRNGLGGALLAYAEKLAIQQRKYKCYIRTCDGISFFQHNGYAVVKSKGKDLVLEKQMSKIKQNYGSPRWSGEIADCTMPMTIDTYSNCSFGCVYCFSQYQRGIGGAKERYLSKDVRSVNPEKVKAIFTDPSCSQFGDYVRTRRVFQWGGLSDQFDEFERKYGVTLELLKFFKEINYPICFSTKGTWWVYDERYTGSCSEGRTTGM